MLKTLPRRNARRRRGQPAAALGSMGTTGLGQLAKQGIERCLKA
jgi:hypothetical protein